MGREGIAYTFVTPEEGGELTRIEMLINRLLKRDEIEGFSAVATAASIPRDVRLRQTRMATKAMNRPSHKSRSRPAQTAGTPAGEAASQRALTLTHLCMGAMLSRGSG